MVDSHYVYYMCRTFVRRKLPFDVVALVLCIFFVRDFNSFVFYWNIVPNGYFIGSYRFESYCVHLFAVFNLLQHKNFDLFKICSPVICSLACNLPIWIIFLDCLKELMPSLKHQVLERLVRLPGWEVKYLPQQLGNVCRGGSTCMVQLLRT